MNILFIITARGGSKGLPGKNIKPLGGKPLLWYSIDFAREFTDDENICLSTDCEKIIAVAEERKLKVPFKRPQHLASDSASSYEVIMHALNFYNALGKTFKAIVLLQPTSPFRKKEFLDEMLEQYDEGIDMVVSVKECHDNPYFSLFEENEIGFLQKSKMGAFSRRQDAPKVYAYNGSIYLINVASLYKSKIPNFQKIKKYVMNECYSIDIDSQFDWLLAETLVNSEYLKK
jgi:CMP-N,N'-diacetyllegionaminic acid synthase